MSGYEVRVYRDSNPENPRLVYDHSTYLMDPGVEDFRDKEDLAGRMFRHLAAYGPVSMVEDYGIRWLALVDKYSHGGVLYSVHEAVCTDEPGWEQKLADAPTSFDRWDTSRTFIVADPDHLVTETDAVGGEEEFWNAVFRSEIEELNWYCEGSVWVIAYRESTWPDGEWESIHGYYGEPEDVVADASHQFDVPSTDVDLGDFVEVISHEWRSSV